MLGLTAIRRQLYDHCVRLNMFDAVVLDEPPSGVEGGLVAWIRLGPGQPVALTSGLDVTSCRQSYSIRIYRNKTAEPNVDVDDETLLAVELLIESLNNDLTLKHEKVEGMVMAVELFDGNNFGWIPAYVRTAETVLRVIEITVPVTIADAFNQER